MEPIKVWVLSAGPNPWKPVILLEELQVPYELQHISFMQITEPEFRKINPTGKSPVIYDPNTDIKIWESGAIILYLIEQYDKEKKLTYDTLKERHLLQQWLMYQMSQQGPFFGQLSWFQNLHSEKVPSAIVRYRNQVERILDVLNRALEGNSWLVGNKCTYADLSFFMWDFMLPYADPEGDKILAAYPNVVAWHERMNTRESTKKVLKTRLALMASEGIPESGKPDNMTYEEMAKRMDDMANQKA